MSVEETERKRAKEVIVNARLAIARNKLLDDSMKATADEAIAKILDGFEERAVGTGEAMNLVGSILDAVILKAQHEAFTRTHPAARGFASAT